jgi:hypothetical protein
LDQKDIIIYSMAAVLVAVTLAYSLQEIEAGIPPTGAVQSIQVQTSHWEAEDREVIATSFNERIYFVTDGSILFNVTSVP